VPNQLFELGDIANNLIIHNKFFSQNKFLAPKYFLRLTSAHTKLVLLLVHSQKSDTAKKCPTAAACWLKDMLLALKVN